MLKDFDAVLDQLQQQGVSIHAISAETGGESEVEARLAERDTVVRYRVHSDPDHKLLLSQGEGQGSEAHSLYIKKEKEAASYGGTYADYVMVQPALMVVHKTGAIQQMWSWNTEPLDAVLPKEEMTPVRSMGFSPLVSVRPVSSDLAPSIQEGRQVKLAGKSIMSQMAEITKTKTLGELKGHMLSSFRSTFGVLKAAFR